MNTLNSPPVLPPEPLSLGEHMQRCAHESGALHRLRCAVEAIDAFLAPRFVTTMALTLVVLVGATLAVTL